MRTLALIAIIAADIGTGLCLSTPASAEPDLQIFQQVCAGARADYTIDQRLYACNQLIAAHGPKDDELAILLLTRSVVFNLKGAPAAAKADIDAAFDISPGVGDAAMRLALKFIQIKKDDVALPYLDRAYQADPHSANILYYRGNAHYDLHQWDLAAKDAGAALQLRPGDPGALSLLANIRAATGDVDGALTLLDQLIAQNPKAESYYNTRCYLRAVADRDVADKALSDCDTAHRLNPRSPDILDSRGLVYLRMGRWADSIADYTAAITLAHHPSPTSFYGRGLAEQQAGNAMSASADIQAAEALSPGIDKKFNTLAMMAE